MTVAPLFDPGPDAAELRELERFGYWDARTGLPRAGNYSAQLSGDRRAAYDRGFSRGIAEWVSRSEDGR